jgi:hypothetical protein
MFITVYLKAHLSKSVIQVTQDDELKCKYNNLILVQEKLFKALGTLAKHIEYVVINPEGLRNMFLGALEMQMVQKEFSNRIVSGAFSGLDHFCESFPFDLDVKENEEIINKLYRFIEKLVIPTTTVKIANRGNIIAV